MSGNPGPYHPANSRKAMPSGGGDAGGPAYKGTTTHPLYPTWCQRYEAVRPLAKRIMDGVGTHAEAAPMRALIVWGKLNGVPAAWNWERILAKRGLL